MKNFNYQQYIPKNVISREKYLQKSLPFLGRNIIKFFLGQRRIGKSYMLFQVIRHIEKTEKNPNIIYINKELPDFRNIKNNEDLINFSNSKLNSVRNYLFIDEIQEIENFEDGLRALLAQRKWDIWCTGSNASLLSDDIAGLLSGRSVEIPVYALNYKEFLQFNGLERGDVSLNKYLRYGGLPFLKHLELSDQVVFEYLKGIYATILFKDIVARENIRNTRFIENLLLFAADNTGSVVSAKSISDFLKSQKINMAPVRVIEYLKYLTNAFFLFKVSRADIQGKRIFEFGEKYYFEDLGLRNVICGFKQKDINKIIENATFLHLKYCGYKIYTGSVGAKEIDFVCERNSEKKYIQVTYMIGGDKVYEREFGNLKAIKDNYPKYVISMDTLKWDNDKGIEHRKLEDFLLSDD